MRGTLFRILCWFMVFLPGVSIGQELIPNGGFERYRNCPRLDNLLEEAVPWFNPNQATPDFYNQCFPTAQIELPPHSGRGLGRLFVDQGWSEYMATPLMQPLTAGECYYFELYISTKNPNQYLPQTIGAYFSDQPVSSSTKDLLTVSPQILDGPRTITKSYQWERISGYLKAVGGERFVTIGSYKKLPPFLGFYYMFLDDISLLPIHLDLGKDTTLCGRRSTLLLNAKTPGVTDYRWNDGSSSPTFTVTRPGKYWVTGITPCKIVSDTIVVDYALDFSLGADTTICNGQTLTLNLPASATNTPVFRWQDGSSQRSYPVNQPGLYSLRIEQGNCSVADTIQVRYTNPPTLELGPNKELCGAETFRINPSFSGGTFTWQDNFTKPERTISQSGVFRATVRNDCATVNDSVSVDYGECGCVIYAPDLFTPNADGLNDTFSPFACGDISLVSLSIFDRWGELVFKTETLPFQWDGAYKGAPCLTGIYAWHISYVLNQGGKTSSKQAQGSISVAR